MFRLQWSCDVFLQADDFRWLLIVAGLKLIHVLFSLTVYFLFLFNNAFSLLFRFNVDSLFLLDLVLSNILLWLLNYIWTW